MRYSNLLEENVEAYTFTSKNKDKAKIVQQIIDSVHQDGGRFLRQDRDGMWEEAPLTVATDKIGHGFRNRKPTKPKTTRPTAQKVKKPIVSDSDASSGMSDNDDKVLGSITQRTTKRQKAAKASSEPQIPEDHLFDLESSFWIM